MAFPEVTHAAFNGVVNCTSPGFTSLPCDSPASGAVPVSVLSVDEPDLLSALSPPEQAAKMMALKRKLLKLIFSCWCFVIKET
jgi:hypothetical protein